MTTSAASSARFRSHAAAAWPRLVAPLLALSCCPLSCAEHRAPAPHGDQRLRPGIAAMVGDEVVSVAEVRGIAAVQRCSLQAARARAVRDALFAASAPEALQPSLRAAVVRAALARALLESLPGEARAQGPVTDGEIEQIIEDRWYELDRAAAARTTHAIVRVKTSEDDAKARKVADALAARVHDATDLKEFAERARSTPSDGLELRLEALPFVTADGRAFRQDKLHAPTAESAHYDPEFARAANALDEKHRISGVVKTHFGYHVIYLEERLPERRLNREERRNLLTDEVISKRAARIEADLLQRLQSSASTSLVRSVDDLTARVPVR